MAGKTYKLIFELSNGNTTSVQFVVPQGERGETGPQGTAGADWPFGILGYGGV